MFTVAVSNPCLTCKVTTCFINPITFLAVMLICLCGCVLHRFLWYLWWGGLWGSQMSSVWLSLWIRNCAGTRQTNMPGWDWHRHWGTRKTGGQIRCATEEDKKRECGSRKSRKWSLKNNNKLSTADLFWQIYLYFRRHVFYVIVSQCYIPVYLTQMGRLSSNQVYVFLYEFYSIFTIILL